MENNITSQEEMLNGETELDHLYCATSWKRVMNAARRTIGKEPLDKEPSLSFKAGILLAEHSPIRLLEYDFGWKKIRQWVTTHLVRHHEGCEKFVHSQRGDRRELPCDRDHIFQGSKNDMDMTCNAQAFINISRKRLCSRASKETREAWKQVMDELERQDPMLRSKCVPECIYRGFCPEFQGSCGYYKTDIYKKQLSEYRRIKYDKNRRFYCINEGENRLQVIIENTGHIYKLEKEFHTGEISYEIIKDYQLEELKYEIHKWFNGDELCIQNPILPISYLVYKCFSSDMITSKTEIIHIDGNIYNNDIDNLKIKNKEEVN